MGEGEGENKPKVERQDRRQQRWPRRRATPAKKEFKAKTKGLEDQVFKQGGAADATAFEEVKTTLSKYAGIEFTVGGHMAQVAIDELRAPNLVEPQAPTAADAKSHFQPCLF